MQGHFAHPLFSTATMQRRTLLKRTLAGSAALALPAFAQARSLLIGQSVALSGPALVTVMVKITLPVTLGAGLFTLLVSARSAEGATVITAGA